MIYELFDDPYIYGPLTEEEFSAVAVHHRMTVNQDGYYIGVSVELPQFSDRAIIRPSHITNVTIEN